MVTSVNLPTAGTAQLSFYSYEQTENFSPYDARYVEVSTNGGGSWTTLGTLTTENVWYQPSFNLTAYMGQNILIRFRFNTVDGQYNNYFGWMVDNVLISADVPPTLNSFTRQNPATSPTNADTLVFRATFSEAVQNVDATDFVVNSTTTATITNVATVSASVYDITVSGGNLASFNGTVGVDLAVGQNIQNLSAQPLPAGEPAIDEIYNLDNIAPTATITSAATNPTSTSPIPVTITFSESVTGFTLGEMTIGNGTAGNFAGSGTTYTADITPSANGVVTVDVGAGVAQDGSGNDNTAAAQFSITYDTINPSVTSTNLNVSYSGTGPASFTVTFSKAVSEIAGTDSVTDLANYLLVNKGTNGTTDTASCGPVPGVGGVKPDDIQVAVSSVSYNNTTFTSTVTLASALPVGSYRLFICGTTSIVDLAGNPLNGGTDYTFDFVVQAAPQSASQTAITRLPATGFPINQVTSLPSQPAKLAYASTDLWLEIPKLGVKMSIVGVPSTPEGWDVTWLDKNAGWLDGSAFPTWNGNSVITAHVWDALNRPGPFANLKNLKYGDQIKIHAFGQVYIFEIRESTTISPTNVSAMLKHEEKSWITLVTCEDYKEQSKTYSSRRMVRAVLIKVTTE
jgi:LPXTG-site transpeptidase (sortase) family protein